MKHRRIRINPMNRKRLLQQAFEGQRDRCLREETAIVFKNIKAAGKPQMLLSKVSFLIS